MIADDGAMARAGIRTLLAQAKDIEIIGEAQSGFEVQELIPRLRPKILLLDYRNTDFFPIYSSDITFELSSNNTADTCPTP